MDSGALGYEDMKRLANDEDEAVRAELAARPDVRPELLYFLASDASPKVRRAVAGNPVTPAQADQVLAVDGDYSVRCRLASKLGGEGLDPAARAKLWRMGTTILETLAHDQFVKVRRALAEALKCLTSVPRPVIRSLARDRAAEVATPVLANSPVLEDSDLVELIRDDPPDWAQAAIARRSSVPSAVAEALVEAGSEDAIAALIANPAARIDEATLSRLVDKAPEVEAWHAPLVERPGLGAEIILRLARFVGDALLSRLGARPDLPPEIRQQIAAEAAQRSSQPYNDLGATTARQRRRGTNSDHSDDAEVAETEAEVVQRCHNGEFVDAQALALFEAGGLDQDAVAEALDRGQSGFVATALALAAGLRLATAQAILDSGSAKSVTALVWKAGYSMRFAMDVQRLLAGIAPSAVLNARDGTDYPLEPEELAEHLALFG